MLLVNFKEKERNVTWGKLFFAFQALLLFYDPVVQCTFDLAHSHTVLYISTIPPPTHSTHLEIRMFIIKEPTRDE